MLYTIEAESTVYNSEFLRKYKKILEKNGFRLHESNALCIIEINGMEDLNKLILTVGKISFKTAEETVNGMFQICICDKDWE